MNYKRIFKSRSLRSKILRTLSWIPDKPMLKIQYRIKTGRKLNLEKPLRYTEKIQWYKLNHKDQEMVRCVDKYDVRSYVEEMGGASILNTCFGVFDRYEDIDFSQLPQSFVMKDTLGGGGNDVIAVKDKNAVNMSEVRNICEN